MKSSKLLLFSLTLLLAAPAAPQNAAPNTAASAPTAVPPLIPLLRRCRPRFPACNPPLPASPS